MKELTVLIYGEQGNNAVIKMPGRKYPGVLIQGDTLKNLLDTSEALVALARQQGNSELLEEAEGLAEMLLEIYRGYMQELEPGK